MTNSQDSNFFNPFDVEKRIHHYVQSLSLNIHHFYIYGVIDDDITKYADFLNVLRTAGETDTIFVYINSEGGAIRMALQIANAMLSSEAKIITSIDGEASSAASIIFLAGEEYIINPNCTFMIHNYSSVIGGKGHELVSQLHHTGATVEKMMRFFYGKILSEEEFEDVCKGRDVWMDSDELTRRLQENQVMPEVIDEVEPVAGDMIDSTKLEDIRPKTKTRKRKKAVKKT